MKCTPIPGGGFICSRGSRKNCRAPGCHERATKQCDYPVVRSGKPGTCDLDVCARHAKPVGPDRDYCPAHAARAAREPTQP